jgi:2-methylisocitrate lyase-like PEP mutase family enzyme
LRRRRRGDPDLNRRQSRRHGGHDRTPRDVPRPEVPPRYGVRRNPSRDALNALAAEQAGIAASHIEDLATSAGKLFVEEGTGGYDFGREQLVPKERAVANIRAAVGARRDPDTVIIGRSDAAAVTSVDDAIDRANGYADAGADLLKFAHLELADLENVPKAVSRPLMYLSLKLPVEEKETAERAGVKIRFHPFASLIPAMDAVITVGAGACPPVPAR